MDRYSAEIRGKWDRSPSTHRHKQACKTRPAPPSAVTAEDIQKKNIDWRLHVCCAEIENLVSEGNNRNYRNYRNALDEDLGNFWLSEGENSGKMRKQWDEVSLGQA